MIEVIYQNYREQKRMIANPEWAENAQEKNVLADMKVSVTVMDEKAPQYKERYEREMKMQESFTPEQKDFICWQIGEWYLVWKDRIVLDLDKGTHKLGYAKEMLKQMICGDE